MKRVKRPEFIRFFRPILSILRESGATGTPAEIVDRSIELAGVSEKEHQAVNKNGQSRIRNQVHWARQYLVWAGYLDPTRRGIWSLTEQGRSTDLPSFDPLHVFKTVQKEKARAKVLTKSTGQLADEPMPDEEELVSLRIRLLEIIRSLSSEGFERLSQRLLRESGFQHVSVTGRSGDGGIDGIGTLQVNPFVSFNVLFQCKRYKGAVTPSQVRDFRGAMMGRADKGIIITTGTFTLEAKKEARRDGVPLLSPLMAMHSSRCLRSWNSASYRGRPLTWMRDSLTSFGNNASNNRLQRTRNTGGLDSGFSYTN